MIQNTVTATGLLSSIYAQPQMYLVSAAQLCSFQGGLLSKAHKLGPTGLNWGTPA